MDLENLSLIEKNLLDNQLSKARSIITVHQKAIETEINKLITPRTAPMYEFNKALVKAREDFLRFDSFKKELLFKAVDDFMHNRKLTERG